MATKPLANTRDLSLAYSPGVATPCEAIAADPGDRYTSKGNLVAVVSNGTAVLGLGNIGAPASKPIVAAAVINATSRPLVSSANWKVSKTWSNLRRARHPTQPYRSS